MGKQGKRLDEDSSRAVDERREGATPARSENAGDERRHHARAPLRTAISLTSESNLYTGFTDDIGEGGVFVSTYRLLEVGEQVDLELSFEDVGGPRVHVRAEVRWVREENPQSDTSPGMGLRFVDLDPSHRAWIEGFVERRDPLFHDDETLEPTNAAAGDAPPPSVPTQPISRGALVVAGLVLALLVAYALVQLT